MLVIHAIWANGALGIWAEDSVLPAHAPRRPGRPSMAPRPHPFAVAPGALADALADVLAAAGAGDLARKAVDRELTVRLPSSPEGPLASNSSDSSSLAAWRVPTLVFEPAAAAALLPELARLAPGDLVVSGSVGYL